MGTWAYFENTSYTIFSMIIIKNFQRRAAATPEPRREIFQKMKVNKNRLPLRNEQLEVYFLEFRVGK